jgi:hypothetical protein
LGKKSMIRMSRRPNTPRERMEGPLAVHRTMLSTGDLVERYAPSVQRTAAAISAELGYR